MKKETESVLLKMIVCGDRCVGKSLLCRNIAMNDSKEIGARRYAGRTSSVGFSSVAYEPTIGLDMAIIRRRLSSSIIAKVHLWDTSGDERYIGIVRSYYCNCCAAIVVVNASDENALESTKKWVRDLRSRRRSDGRSLIVSVFADIGNGKHKRSQDIAKFCDESSIHYFEVQIWQNKQLEESLGSLLNTIYETYIAQGLETEGIGLVGCSNIKSTTGMHPLINHSSYDSTIGGSRIQDQCCTIL